MTVNWRTVALEPLDALLADASQPVRRVETVERLSSNLRDAGELYDVLFPPPPAPDTPSVLGESAEHIAWRTVSMPAALAELDEVAAALDGGPPTSIDSSSLATLSASEAAIFERLAEAASLEPPPGRYAAILAETPKESLLPRRPDPRRAEYYRRVSGLVTLGNRARAALAAMLEAAHGPRPNEFMREKIRILRSTGQVDGYLLGNAGDAEIALNSAITNVNAFLATFDT